MTVKSANVENGPARTETPRVDRGTEPALPLALLLPLSAHVVRGLDCAGALVTASLLLVAALGLGGPARVLLALAFVTFVPGWALVGHLPLVAGATSRIALAVAMSLATCAVIVQSLLWLGIWNPATMLGAFGSVSLGVLLGQLLWPRSSGASDRRSAAGPDSPVWVAQIDLDKTSTPRGVARSRRPDDSTARLLVRMRGEVLGFVDIELADDADSADDQARSSAVLEAVFTQLAAPLARHLRAVTIGPTESFEPITVVVCTRDRADILAECLRLLAQLRYGAFEVVVVDNAPSTTVTWDCFRAEVGDDARFRYVQEPAPGLSRARNTGLAEATTKFVAFTDDDALVDPQWLDHIAGGFARHPRVGCVTGLVPPAELNNAAHHYFDRRFSWANHLDPAVYALPEPKGRRLQPLYPYSAGLFGTGANFAVDRSMLLALGGFDEALGAGSPARGGEDLDVFVRILRSGRTLAYEPSAVVWHHHRDDAAGLRRQLFGYGSGLTAFLSKHATDRRTARDVLARVPAAAQQLWRMWNPSAAVAAAAPTARPRLVEMVGMCAGPMAYVRGRRRLTRLGHPVPVALHLAQSPRDPNEDSRRLARRHGSRPWPTALVLPAALVLWVTALRVLNTDAIDDWGLLPALPLAFFVALALVVASSVIALGRPTLSPLQLTLHLVALVVVLHGTVALIFPDPIYPWTYKHIGVTNYINTHGALDASVDIYQNWPGFFALAAWFTSIAGLASPLSFAKWAPVYFNLLFCLQLAFVVRWLPLRQRERWLALFLFAAANWVGQDYFAPQALAFVLCLATFAMVLVWLRTDAYPAPIRLVRRVARWMTGAAPADSPEHVSHGPRLSGWPRAAALACLFAVFAVVVVTHQLSPFLVLTALGLLVMTGTVKPRWVVVVLAALAMGYLLMHLAYMRSERHLAGSPFNPLDVLKALSNPFENAQSSGFDSADPMPGRRLTALAAPALILGLWALGAIGAMRRLRAGRPVLLLALLAASPALIALGEDYGGEAIFRIFLFSLPWTAVLAACALAPRYDRWRATTKIRVAVGLSVVLVLFMSAFYGSMELYRVRPGAVLASQYYFDHAPPGSVLGLASSNVPGRIGSNYDEYVDGFAPPPLSSIPELLNRVLGPADIPLLNQLYEEHRAAATGGVFLSLSRDQTTYVEVLGLMPERALAGLDKALAEAPEWRLFYRNADAAIYEFMGGDGPTAAPSA